MLLLVSSVAGEFFYELNRMLVVNKIPVGVAWGVYADLIDAVFQEPSLSHLQGLVDLKNLLHSILLASAVSIESEAFERVFLKSCRGVKQQILACSCAMEMLQISLNHFSQLRNVAFGEGVVKLGACIAFALGIRVTSAMRRVCIRLIDELQIGSVKVLDNSWLAPNISLPVGSVRFTSNGKYLVRKLKVNGRASRLAQLPDKVKKMTGRPGFIYSRLGTPGFQLIEMRHRLSVPPPYPDNSVLEIYNIPALNKKRFCLCSAAQPNEAVDDDIEIITVSLAQTKPDNKWLKEQFSVKGDPVPPDQVEQYDTTQEDFNSMFSRSN